MSSQKIKKTEQSLNELSEPPKKRKFLALSTMVFFCPSFFYHLSLQKRLMFLGLMFWKGLMFWGLMFRKGLMFWKGFMCWRLIFSKKVWCFWKDLIYSSAWDILNGVDVLKADVFKRLCVLKVDLLKRFNVLMVDEFSEGLMFWRSMTRCF